MHSLKLSAYHDNIGQVYWFKAYKYLGSLSVEPAGELMPEFKTREEYEAWKTQKKAQEQADNRKKLLGKLIKELMSEPNIDKKIEVFRQLLEIDPSMIVIGAQANATAEEKLAQFSKNLHLEKESIMGKFRVIGGFDNQPSTASEVSQKETASTNGVSHNAPMRADNLSSVYAKMTPVGKIATKIFIGFIVVGAFVSPFIQAEKAVQSAREGAQSVSTETSIFDGFTDESRALNRFKREIAKAEADGRKYAAEDKMCANRTYRGMTDWNVQKTNSLSAPYKGFVTLHETHSYSQFICEHTETLTTMRYEYENGKWRQVGRTEHENNNRH